MTGSVVTTLRDFDRPINKFQPHSETRERMVKFALRPKDVYNNAIDVAASSPSLTNSLNDTIYRPARNVDGAGGDSSVTGKQLLRKLEQTKASGEDDVKSKSDLVSKGKVLLLKAQNNRDKLYPCLMLSLALSMLAVVFIYLPFSGLIAFLLIFIFIIMFITTLLLFRI